MEDEPTSNTSQTSNESASLGKPAPNSVHAARNPDRSQGDDLSSSSPAPSLQSDWDAVITRRLSLSIVDIAENTGTTLVITTEDKLRLCLKDHLAEIERSRDWVAPTTLFISLLLVFATTEFRDFILSKETWSAVFYIALVVNVLWFLRTMQSAFKRRTIDSLISSIKGGMASTNADKE